MFSTLGGIVVLEATQIQAWEERKKNIHPQNSSSGRGTGWNGFLVALTQLGRIHALKGLEVGLGLVE
jgi:hypothetical protein